MPEAFHVYSGAGGLDLATASKVGLRLDGLAGHVRIVRGWWVGSVDAGASVTVRKKVREGAADDPIVDFLDNTAGTAAASLKQHGARIVVREGEAFLTRVETNGAGGALYTAGFYGEQYSLDEYAALTA